MSLRAGIQRWTMVVILAAAMARAQDYGNDKPPPAPEVSVPLTDEQKRALHAIDVRLAGVEALAQKIDDAAYRKTTESAIADLKRRRKALEKNFDAGLHESLMHSVISRYQIIALWLTPPRLPPPAKSQAAAPSAEPGKPDSKSSP